MKARLIRMSPHGVKAARLHLTYIERDGVGSTRHVLAQRAGRVGERHEPTAERNEFGAECPVRVFKGGMPDLRLRAV